MNKLIIRGKKCKSDSYSEIIGCCLSGDINQRFNYAFEILCAAAVKGGGVGVKGGRVRDKPLLSLLLLNVEDERPDLEQHRELYFRERLNKRGGWVGWEGRLGVE